MNSTVQTGGVFLNGKAQVVEMLKYMTPAERDKLIKNIRIKNSALADELVLKSFTFDDLAALADHEIKMIFQYVTAPILGIALKNAETSFQRRILALANRDYAENAYQILTTTIPNEIRDTKRAQDKIIRVLSTLGKRKQISLNI